MTQTGTSDPLTGLADRPEFMRVGVQRSEHGPPEAQVGLILADLHRFSTINHAVGFAAGDALLRDTAGRLVAVAPGALVARLGPDEFGVLVEGLDVAHVAEIAAEIQAECGRAFGAMDASLASLSLVTIGIATARCEEGVAVLLERAETALGAAKGRGGMCVETFDPTRHGAIVERKGLELELFGAGARGELRLHHQPIVDLNTSAVVGFEALVRWDRPGHGLIPPGSFIEAAEECGAIVALGEWVLEDACRQALVWNQPRSTSPSIMMSVNVSACQLRSPRFVDSVATILAAVGIEPQVILLEITETALNTDTDAMVDALGDLKDLGVLLAIDDFGTGYSSLSQLRRLPVDVVKIDRAFVSGVASDSEEWAMAVAIVNMATSLGKRTLAEGIETAAQLAHLRSLGCELGQGFLFSPPRPADEAWQSLEPGRGPDPCGAGLSQNAHRSETT
ncbi:MAG TPA: bifunctional diguanylate cyclase/phosphodiesterase [Acidimicrobiia bacterium]|nr:bifunctional diguanylate cyclase/phosphodiesterase [Acidimicrobiia bacterium]